MVNLNKDIYVPRKCSVTHRLIGAKDHASVQINIGKLDENGVYTGHQDAFAISGPVRATANSDDSLNRLAQGKGHLCGVWSPTPNPIL